MPSEFQVQTPVNNSTWDSISQGEMKLIGLKGLKSISISSFFPAQQYSFARNAFFNPYDYIEMIETWIDRRIPIRLIITETPVNMACSIESFDWGEQDGSRDIYYTLSLSEFKFVQLETRQV